MISFRVLTASRRVASRRASGTLQKYWSQIVIRLLAWATALAIPAMTVNSPRSSGPLTGPGRSGIVRHIWTVASPSGFTADAFGSGRTDGLLPPPMHAALVSWT